MSNLMDLIYENCAMRVKREVKKSGKPLQQIYADHTLISKIQNNKRVKRSNPYLVPDRVFESFYTEEGEKESGQEGLLHTLSFKSRQDVLWGTIKERKESINGIYKALIQDLLADSRTENVVENFLCGYAEYAFYYTYYNFLLENRDIYPALFYGFREDDIWNNIALAQEEAIDFMFVVCQEEIETYVLEFMECNDSFTKIDKRIMKELVNGKFIPMMERYANSDTSLGNRTIRLIKGDLLQVGKMMALQNSTSQQRELVRATSKYLYQIADIQKNLYGFESSLHKCKAK